MARGSVQLAIPVLDPLRVGAVPLTLSTPDVSLQANISETKLTGLSTFVIDSVEVDPVTQQIRLALNMPAIRLTGSVCLAGLVGRLFPLDGCGLVRVTAKNIPAYARVGFDNRTDGSYHLQIFDVDLEWNQSNIDMRLQGCNISAAALPVLNKWTADTSHLLLPLLAKETRRQLSQRFRLEIGGALWSISVPRLWRETAANLVGSSANADGFFDRFMPYLQSYILQHGLDPLPLPVIEATGDSSSPQWPGAFLLADGASDRPRGHHLQRSDR
ncbi:uncharacterized protein LOC119108099 [Pollicipes pollicipes]|uniref:uncharacterized protein LOC119108099 n=1 Tax=Pollicipes pollicipes TaxID=41117 RepID=UPI0018853BB3|nr:uncharacterized protein LOC119108099 [Pollicipes pollicipes]